MHIRVYLIFVCRVIFMFKIRQSIYSYRRIYAPNKITVQIFLALDRHSEDCLEVHDGVCTLKSK